jgi:hypothetical protein
VKHDSLLLIFSSAAVILQHLIESGTVMTFHHMPSYTHPLSQPNALRHSGLGIASVVIGAIGALTVFATVIVAGYLEMSTPGGMDEDSPVVTMLGLVVCTGCLTAMIGAGLAAGGLFQPNRNRVLPIIGLVINGVIILTVMVLMVVGLMMG